MPMCMLILQAAERAPTPRGCHPGLSAKARRAGIQGFKLAGRGFSLARIAG
jgi:hypothetical protein